jgi:hypothetical protein
MEKGTVIEIKVPYKLLLRKGAVTEMMGYTGRNAEIIMELAK